MKLHDNSRFRGGWIVLGSSCNLLKFHQLIEIPRGLVRFPDFQKNGAGEFGQKRIDELPCKPPAPEFPGHREIQNLPFIFRDTPRHQESGHSILTDHDSQVVLQICRYIPWSGFGAGCLNGGDRLQIAPLAATDCWHSVNIMIALLGLLFFLAQPFWEAKPPEKWTDLEVDAMLHASPWAERLGPDPEALIWLATAAPIEAAEEESRVRAKLPPAQTDPDYADYLRQNREESFVLAISYLHRSGLGTSADQKRMEDECEMRIGKRSYKMLGHFPPTTDDPVLRLIFPRTVRENDKTVVFRLFLPGMSFPERELELRVKDLMYRGKLEM